MTRTSQHLPSQKRDSFSDSLLGWYQKNQRDLPWRRTKDAYSIWVSEIMLQQTTVKTVIPYFERFIKKFPNFQSMAQAKEADFLAAWQGLGYYNRIRNFHKACQILVEQGCDRVPSKKSELLQLPGLGEYTASAVASIAFGEPVSVVDGNVIRVLSRLFGYSQDIKSGAAKLFFSEKSQQLLDQYCTLRGTILARTEFDAGKNNPGDFNQAMMELGATVCLPQKPTCLVCPVSKNCHAFKTATPHLYPFKAKKMVYTDRYFECLIDTKNDMVFLRKKKDGEIMQGLWELPLVEIENQKEPKKSYPVKHSIMSDRYHVKPVKANLQKEMSGKWFGSHTLKKIPTTTLTKKVLKHIGLER